MDLGDIFGTIGGIVAISGAIIAWLNRRATVKALESAAKKDDVEALVAIIDTLKEELERQEKKSLELAAELEQQKVENAQLLKEYKKLKANYDRLLEWARAQGLEPFQEEGSGG